MKREIPITIEWLEAHGFKKLTGMHPVGCGETYFLNITKNESIYINISTTPDNYGRYPLHLSINNQEEQCDFYRTNIELSKKQYNEERTQFNCFYVEELLLLLDLTDNEDLKVFFE